MSTQVLRFTAAADAYVDETQPYSNFGGAPTVRVNGGPKRDGLLRFDVSSLQGQVTSATLRVYVTDGTANNVILWSAFHPISESSVTWNSHPGTVGASSYLGPASAGRWLEWRLPYFHTSDLDFVLRLDGTDELAFASRESATPPELVVVVESTPPLAAPLPPSNALPRDGSTRVLAPVADATVDESRPTTALGGAASLSVDGSPRQYSFLRFNVGSLPAPIRSAKVRLHATGETVKGPALHATTGAWAESSVTWQTRPAPSGSAFGTAAAVRAGDWVEYDVTARVRGPGQYDFGLYATSDDGVTLHAREGGIAVARPQLVLELDVPPLATDACGSRPHLSEVEGYVHPDTYVSSAEPTTRFNTRATVRVDGSPREEGYLSVSVPAWSGRLVRAVLRLYADTETVDGPKLYRTAPWSRPDFNWNERPALVGSALADSAQISAGGWVEFDVTAAITGEGTYGFALIPDSSDSVAFISEDAVSAALAPWSLRPHLRLTTESAPTCSRRGTGGATTMTRRVGGGGDELPEAFARAPDGGWVVVGSAANGGVFGGTVVSGSAELVVSRYAADGTHRWTRVLARSGVRARDVVVTGLGNVLMVGTYQGTPDLGTGPLPGPIGGFFAKLSPEGAVVWTRGVTATTCDSDGCYPRDVVPHAVTTDANGSLIASGAFWGLADFGGGPLDAGPASHGWDDAPSGMFVLKLAWDGVHLWSQSMPGRYLGAVGHSLGTDSNGDVLVGAALPTTGIEQPTVLKLSPRGAVLWTRSLQGARGGAGKIAVLPDGSAGFRVRFEGQFTFAGSTYSNTESFGEPDDVLAVVGPDGSERASRGLPGMILEDLTADAQGGLRAVLRLDSSDFAVDLGAGPVGSPAVARFTPSLGVQWYRSFDPNMERLFVDGANVVGAFRLPVLHEGRWLASPNQSWDTLLFQLGP